MDAEGLRPAELCDSDYLHNRMLTRSVRGRGGATASAVARAGLQPQLDYPGGGHNGHQHPAENGGNEQGQTERDRSIECEVVQRDGVLVLGDEDDEQYQQDQGADGRRPDTRSGWYAVGCQGRTDPAS